jgi:hypothetical protein
VRGCLTAPFKLLGCLGVIIALAVGWLYRDRVVREGRRLLGLSEAPAAGSAASRGRPGSRSLASGHAKIDSLNGWRADSVVLTPSEVASLLGNGLDPTFRKELDSLQIELLDGEIRVRARLRTARLPAEAVGPFASALRPTEPVQATGPLRVTGPGAGEWVVRSFQIRDFPVPAPAIPRLVSRALGDPSRETAPVKIPAGIRAIRLTPGGAILYGAPRP